MELSIVKQNMRSINQSFYSINYSVKYSTVDFEYLLFLQDLFFWLKPK